jgi:glycosyltransferase involved in cell wall biosynthesis
LREFIEAARITKQDNPNAQFELLGPVDVTNRSAVPRAQIEKWVAAGIVTYLGETDDVRPFIAAADCIVLPSYREGAPRTLLEAAAMGRPVITSDAVGCADVVEDRQTGLVCRVRDEFDLSAKIRDMIALGYPGRMAMGLKGRQKVEREYDEQIVVSRYLNVVNPLLAG